MPAADLLARGAHVMTVCNACRYCEQYCPVFPAMEMRERFEQADLAYLSNLCHNCGECLYACQYAPPHEFGINVPRTLAQIRVQSYEDYCWPHALGVAFRRHSVGTALGLAGFLALVIVSAVLIANAGSIPLQDSSADFYKVVPHGVMVGLFGAVFAFVCISIGVSLVRFWRDANVHASSSHGSGASGALRDVLTLRHLQTGAADCVSSEEQRTPWRRWCHHSTFYGFALCFASTTVAAIYHSVFGWVAPYGYSSLPVILGVLGGAGLLAGTAGLFVLRRQRDPALGDPSQQGLDESFLALLFLTTATGFALLFLRQHPVMGLLLAIHLGTVLALLLTLPYGKFVHGLYRATALLLSARERATPSR